MAASDKTADRKDVVIIPKYLGVKEEIFGDSGMYELRVPLPTDGTPITRTLRIAVAVGEYPTEVSLYLETAYESDKATNHPPISKLVGKFDTNNDAMIADLLYPAAKLVTRTSISPT